MIEAFNLVKTFGEFDAVQNVSFNVPQGTTTVLLGTSGSGKTTTLKMINRLIEPSAGNILISGKDIREKKPELLRREIGYVSQNDGLFPHFTVAQNIGIVPQLLGWTKQKVYSETQRIMANVLLSFQDYAQKFPHQLSGGQKQRVALARAIIAGPAVILMDEPFEALDPVTRVEIRREFADVIRSSGITTVLVTHDVAEAVELGDEILLMDKGEIVQKGSPNDLILNPNSQFSRDFIQDQNLVLALSVIPISAIWEELLPASSSGTGHISADTTIWNTANLITTENLTAIDIRNPEGEMRSANLAVLMAGYQKWRLKNG